MKKSLLFLVPLILSTFIFAQTPVYYPLNVGDFWQFYFNVNREVLKDTVFLNGKTYAQIDDEIYQNFYYQRQAGDSVFQWDHFNNQEQLFYDFSRQAGDTIASFPRGSDTTDIILLSINTVNIFGRNLLQWTFLIDWERNSIDDEDYHEITDSLGLTRWSDFWISFILQGAIINGIQYGSVTALNVPKEDFPGEIQLYQNYPNPFNPSTNISYFIPISSDVTLKIYDILGYEVQTIVDEFQNVGTYSYNFNAGNFSSGLYIYRVEAGNYRVSKKMLLLR